jgi:hypothetical protein
MSRIVVSSKPRCLNSSKAKTDETQSRILEVRVFRNAAPDSPSFTPGLPQSDQTKIEL